MRNAGLTRAADLPTPDQDLLASARAARETAYCPYSKFAVGAALRTVSGVVYRGCNVENASLGLTVCAERNAVAAAVAGGMRPGELTAIALVGGGLAGGATTARLSTEQAGPEPAAPCGACRQVLAEFAAPDCRVLSQGLDGLVRTWLLTELLPDRFYFDT